MLRDPLASYGTHWHDMGPTGTTWDPTVALFGYSHVNLPVNCQVNFAAKTRRVVDRIYIFVREKKKSYLSHFYL